MSRGIIISRLCIQDVCGRCEVTHGLWSSVLKHQCGHVHYLITACFCCREPSFIWLVWNKHHIKKSEQMQKPSRKLDVSLLHGPQPECVICQEKLANASMVPAEDDLGNQTFLLRDTWAALKAHWSWTRSSRAVCWTVWKCLSCTFSYLAMTSTWKKVPGGGWD